MSHSCRTCPAFPVKTGVVCIADQAGCAGGSEPSTLVHPSAIRRCLRRLDFAAPAAALHDQGGRESQDQRGAKEDVRDPDIRPRQLQALDTGAQQE